MVSHIQVHHNSWYNAQVFLLGLRNEGIISGAALSCSLSAILFCSSYMHVYTGLHSQHTYISHVQVAKSLLSSEPRWWICTFWEPTVIVKMYIYIYKVRDILFLQIIQHKIRLSQIGFCIFLRSSSQVQDYLNRWKESQIINVGTLTFWSVWHLLLWFTK